MGDIYDEDKLEVKRNTSYTGEGLDEVELYNYRGVNTNLIGGVHQKITCAEAMSLGVQLIRASRPNYRE